MASYNHAPITAATIWTRPKEMEYDLAGHWGIVVNVQGYGKYLIHNTPGSGTVATPASNMSSKWTSVASIPVSSGKTIRGCMLVSGGAHTNYVSQALARYIMGATCVGTTAAIANYLLE